MFPKKILLATKNQADTTSFLRAWGPFTATEMKPYATPFRYPDSFEWVADWTRYVEVDVVYLHRPADGQSLHILERAKLMGIPVWCDMDDDLQNITTENPVYANYATDSVRKCIDHCIREADVLTVGGKSHAERLREQYKREVILIPNTLDDRLVSIKKEWGANKYKRKPVKDLVSWRGSRSHDIDLVEFKEEILELIKNTQSADWIFMGHMPPIQELKEFNNVRFSSEQNLFEFYNFMAACNAEIQIIPLIENEFNRVKSNLAWQDGTVAGSACLCPNFGEYKDIPGMWHYSNKYEFRQGFKELKNNPELCKEMVKKSWVWIMDNILLSKVNKLRIEILKNI